MDLDFHLIIPPNANGDALYNEWKTTLKRELSENLQRRFNFVRCRLDDLPGTRFNAIVSPANSYGRLDGGFDGAISELFSPEGDYLALTRHVQKVLYSRSRGFAPPGSSSIIALPSSIRESQAATTGCEYIVLCPTMHWPMTISWHHDIVYNVMWALLAAIDQHNAACANATKAAEDRTAAPREKPTSITDKLDEQQDAAKPIRSILMPALGVGTGGLSYGRFTAQFAMAVRNFDEAIRKPEKWASLDWAAVHPMTHELERTWSSEGQVAGNE